MLDYCDICVNPKGLGIVNPATDQELQFYEGDQGYICEICWEMLFSGKYPSRQKFDLEFEEFLNSQQRILFAYSGGLDSTVVLAKLIVECQRRKIELITFTIETGMKGKVAGENIANVLDHFHLQKNHLTVNITNVLQNDHKIVSAVGSPMTTFDVYKVCREKSILPCGKICNAMVDSVYEDVMQEYGVCELVTGGDTPKKNSVGVYSLLWNKPSGITIVRGGFAFGMTKLSNAKFIADNSIPWTHPHCGGYDTDCLVPGVFFAEQLDHQAEQKAENVIKRFPIILEYLSERVRFGVIDRDEGLRMLSRVDIASKDTYQEFIDIVK
ncbi:MAG: hypothetical protein V1838_05470 [Patescibacteria group bacterium]